MFKNNLTTAVRNFWRNRTFSIINVLGLSIGISAALVIFLIAFFEFSFDKFEPGADRIFRVVLDVNYAGSDGHSAAVPAPLGAAIETEVTGVEQTIPIFQFQGDATAKVAVATTNPGKTIIYKKQQDIVFTNTQYFYLLPHQWLAGSPKVSLSNPFSVVLTESRAMQYFPSVPAADIIGRQLIYNDEITVTVSGIVKDLSQRTGFKAVEFISLPTIAKTNLENQLMMKTWNDWMAYSQLYIKLAKGTNPVQTEAQLKVLMNKYNKDANKDPKNSMAFHLQPLDDVHFNNQYQGVNQRQAHKPTLYGLLAIAAFLLLLGCINFINLTTAQASRRAKEIGIRKTMGSSKKQLVVQFLSETFFITSIATVLSIAIMPLLLKMFGDYIPPGLQFSILQEPAIILLLALLIILVSFLSGVYPALVLSGYNPVAVLKGQAFASSSETRHAWVRKTLTVSQFVIAQFFIIATVMVSKQINYSLNTDLGFNKEAIISFELPRDTVAVHGRQLLNEIKAIPEVAIASTGFLSPSDMGVAFTNISYSEKPDVKPTVQIRWGDTNYVNVYGLKLLAGRNVTPSDTIKEFIINDTYAKLLGFNKPEDALNKRLEFNGKKMPIIGVMQDFHDQSFRAPITPLVLAGNNGSTFHIKLMPNTADGKVWQNAISKIQRSFKQIYPDADFNYSFYDESVAKQYQAEQNTAALLKWATGLAIFISCLGLLGLVIYTTNTRTKEIGIRKILGASVVNIIAILSEDFVKLVVIAFVIAVPLGWWAMYQWLENFAYRTTISWWVFAGSGVAMLLLAVVTLSMQTIRSAIVNPAKILRTE